MTTTVEDDDDDEWARSDVTLRILSNDDAKQRKAPSTASVPILPSSNRYNPLNNNAPIYDQVGVGYNSGVTNMNYNANYPPNNIIQVFPLPEDQIDSALLSAISNPRERMQLFQIEDTILKFVNSDEKSLEFPPVHNSFRRLLAYRVGQRFGMSHSTADSSVENGERSITLFKTGYTARPKTLLIDLNIPVDNTNTEDALDFANASQMLTSQPIPLESVVCSAPSSSQPAKKFQLMKRNSAKQSSDGVKVVVPKQQQTEEDREKAYNEARARIFGDEGGSGQEGGSEKAATSTASSKESSSASPLPSPAQPATSSASGKQGAANSSYKVNTTSSKNSSTASTSSIHKSSSDASLEVSKSTSTNSQATTAVRKAASSSSLVAEGSQGSTTQPTQSVSQKGSGKSNRTDQAATLSLAERDRERERNRSSDSSLADSTSSSGGGSGKHGKSSGNSGTNNNSNSNNSHQGGNGDKANQSVRKKAVDVASWKGNKSQVRDVDAERSDPDFMRRSSPSLLANSLSQMQLQQQQQQQQQLQQQMSVNRQSSNSNPSISLPLGAMQLPQGGEGLIYIQNGPVPVQAPGGYMGMLPPPGGSVGLSAPVLYPNQPSLDPAAQHHPHLLYAAPHHPAAMNPSFGRPPDGIFLPDGNSGGGNGQAAVLQEYPQIMQHAVSGGGFYPQQGGHGQGPILLAPSLQQPVSLLPSGPVPGGPVYFQQQQQPPPQQQAQQQQQPGASGAPIMWQQQQMNMMQMQMNPFYPPPQGHQIYIGGSSSADSQQQQQQQQQQLQLQQLQHQQQLLHAQAQQAQFMPPQQEVFQYHGNPQGQSQGQGQGQSQGPPGGYYDYPPSIAPGVYYQQQHHQQQQQQQQQQSQQEQSSPTKSKKIQRAENPQRIFSNAQFPPLG